RLTEKEKGVKLIEEGREKGLNYFHTDPYWAAFFKALKTGWK
ncbi:MAG TPA: AIR synthase, partial [Porphyromonadaceae bacterium]|nr:AIR synthase [Porphyromonadaceae bacterium]